MLQVKAKSTSVVVTGIGHGTEHKLRSAKLSKHVTWIFLWLCKIIKAGCSHCFQLPTFCRPCQAAKSKRGDRINRWWWFDGTESSCNATGACIDSTDLTRQFQVLQLRWLAARIFYTPFHSLDSSFLLMTKLKEPLPTLYLNPSSFWILNMPKAYPLWPANKNSDVHY